MGDDPLLRKLENVARLTEAERALVGRFRSSARDVPRRRDIISAGSAPTHVHLMLEGWAARYAMLPNGTRQITAFLLPGDFCDLHITILDAMDHGIVALTDCRVAYVRPDTVNEITRSTGPLVQAFWWLTLVDEAILRQWVVNNGRRDATASMAHLLCELHLRMTMIGRVTSGRFGLPLTQEELGDALGLTTVHTNRMLQRLRADGLITLEAKTLVVEDIDGLREIAGFAPDYLHIRGLARPAH